VATSPHDGEPFPATDPATVANNAVALICAVLAATATLQGDNVAWGKVVVPTAGTATTLATSTAVNSDGRDLVVPCAMPVHLVAHQAADLLGPNDCHLSALVVSVLVDSHDPATRNDDGRKVIVLDANPAHPVGAPGERLLVPTEVAVLVEGRVTAVRVALPPLDAAEPLGFAATVTHAAKVPDAADVAGLAVTVAHAATVTQPAGTALLVLHAATVTQPAATAALVLHALAPADVAGTALLVPHAFTVLQPASAALLVTHAMPVPDPTGAALLVAHAATVLEPAGLAALVAHAATVAKVAGTALLVAHATTVPVVPGAATLVAHAPAVAEVATTAVAVLHAAAVTPAPALADRGPPQTLVRAFGLDTMRLCPLEEDFHLPLVGPVGVAVAETGPGTAPALEGVECTALHRPFAVVAGRHPNSFALLEDATLRAALHEHGGRVGSEHLGGEFLSGILRFWDGRSDRSDNEKNSNSLHSLD